METAKGTNEEYSASGQTTGISEYMCHTVKDAEVLPQRDHVVIPTLLATEAHAHTGLIPFAGGDQAHQEVDLGFRDPGSPHGGKDSRRGIIDHCVDERVEDGEFACSSSMGIRKVSYHFGCPW
ncbi:hypothetical protein A0H81_00780 [Grifola frondosa]|uniref:Uncharacterized protein n=1 Tax=Grifola frondosa TaxID=5627 RepID=A0A1C7MP41_GRIFR|nr:hypothetical protein A0H81_00780 [Grifola frondosa]